MPIAGENPIDAIPHILKTVFEKSVICAVEPMALEAIADLLALNSVKQVYRLLHPLRSVLHVPRDTGVVNTLHASFPDFMLSSARSLDFCCDRAGRHTTLAQACLGLIDTAEPKMNICRLPSSHHLDEEVEDLRARVAWAISPGLAYASDTGRLTWIAAQAQLSMQRDEHGAPEVVTQIAHDAWQFVSVYANHPTHIPRIHAKDIRSGSADRDGNRPTKAGAYGHLEGLDQNSEIDQSVRVSGWSRCLPTAIRSPLLRKGILYLWDIGNGGAITALLPDDVWDVTCIAFSVDGSRVACGMNNGDVYICSLRHTAGSLGPLKGHTDWTIRVWNMQTGEQVGQPFEGHTDWVRSVCFTTDGSRLASGSDDKTVRLWDIKTGKTASEPLTGHSGYVYSVAFSPNGKLLASASQDKTIHVDTHPTPTATLTSTSPIYCIRYATAGSESCLAHRMGRFMSGTPRRYIASASCDSTLRIWNAHTGKDIHGSMRGHTDNVNGVRFLPDGLAIVSGSDDGTVRMWDVSTGQQLARLLEARNRILSVGVSSDGQHVVCGSMDGTIQVVDRHGGKTLDEPISGHTNWVRSVDSLMGCVSCQDQMMSRCGYGMGRQGKQLVVCGERDTAHSGWVRSVSTSPDGLYVASGSDDRSVRVWDGQTGKLILGPLRDTLIG
ncbi:WD40 repeat-like protein [Rhizoctonia solani]|uniref:WD40 repeat-like protein n=1 Tax=Rhizoctonia solani TaxID=456999 RepID=A0A8H7LYU1_9AGAM|nr:WD40 repeat-like protein [Rhizoctonia solani]